ncbi:MAG: hypothetical protein SF051_10565 [Elusimicrobiota bacterium]|nr:hypothetical protein [Elusimicrobiota bacterium]
MNALLLLALGLAAAQTKAVVGEETTIVVKELPASTTDFVVVKSQARDGGLAVTVLPLAPGKQSFAGIEFEVAEPPLPDDADIADIKPPLAARPALWPWVLLALLAAAAWYARRAWRARRGAAPPPPAEPPLPLEFRIERRLAELEASGLWERGEHAAYYLRLTEILRSYLEERWGVPATAMTTVEVSRLVKARADLDAASEVRALLERADLVKFARVTPLAQDGPKDLERARRFVFATTTRAPAAGGAA